MLEIHERIRKRRERIGLKQNQMADLLKMPANTYNGYETGKRKIDSILLKEIAGILKCSSDYLLGNIDNLYPEYKVLGTKQKIAMHIEGKIENLGEEGMKELDNYLDYLQQKYRNPESK